MTVRTRFKIKHGGAPMTLAADHQAVARGEPLFPSQVYSARDLDHLLMEGANNRKLGSHWAKGPWRGTLIYSLSLPERSTCPRSCPVWDSCMGNTQPYTVRVKGDRYLIPKIRREVENLASFGVPFSVRLHALGDFFSTTYVEAWISLVHRFQNLHVFGFTAHGRTTHIGRLIERESRNWDRFRVRFSGSAGERSSTVKADPPAGRQVDGITCPVEVPRGKSVPNCGSCGLCLTSRDPIVFRLH
jgi:hypothetical protein